MRNKWINKIRCILLDAAEIISIYLPIIAYTVLKIYVIRGTTTPLEAGIVMTVQSIWTILLAMNTL